jgi:periplasmic protein TonB
MAVVESHVFIGLPEEQGQRSFFLQKGIEFLTHPRLFAWLVVGGLHIVGIGILAHAGFSVDVRTSPEPIEVVMLEEIRTKPQVWTPAPIPTVSISAQAPAQPSINLSDMQPLEESDRAIRQPTTGLAVTAGSAGSATLELSDVAYLRPPAPRYPAASRRLREEGIALLRVLVNEKGLPQSIELYRSSGHDLLDQAAREAIMRAAFLPYVVDGIARAAYVVIPIEFTLRR